MRMYKDEELTIPALCPLRDMAQCVSECAFAYKLCIYPDTWCCELPCEGGAYIYQAQSDEPAETDGRE